MFEIGDKVIVQMRGRRFHGQIRHVDGARQVCLVDHVEDGGPEFVAFEQLSKLEDGRPLVVASPDWSRVRNLCAGYLHELQRSGFADDDTERYVFEAAMEALYGSKVFEWVRQVQR